MPSTAGGKAKIGKQIYEFIKGIEQDNDQPYFEPFCGLLGVGIHFLKDKRKTVHFCDKNEDMMLMWKELQDGWVLPHESCCRDEYKEFKKSDEHSAIRGFMGIASAYSGIFFAGYRPNSIKQNFFTNTRNGLMKMVEHLNCTFLDARDYRSFHPKGKTIYVDPPYFNNNIQSEHFNNFDHDVFWDIMRKWSVDNLVIISEYQAPDDFKMVWSKPFSSVYHSKINNYVEKLFMLSS